MSNTIGLSFDNGFAGSYSRQPDQIIDSHVTGTGGAAFGQALVYSSGAVVAFGGSNVAADFVGVAAREVKTTAYGTSQGGYVAGEPASVMKRGRILVKCQNGTPALNGDVYIRTTLNASYPDAVVGGFEAAADSTYSVKVTNLKWRGAADANGIAELSILYPVNA